MLPAFPKAGFIAWSCLQSFVSFLKSANTGEYFICAKGWGYCGYCNEGDRVPSLNGLFPCPTPWALLVSFCHLSQAVCLTHPSPQLPDTPGKGHGSMY